jgi:hypothetical protein
VVWVRLDVGGDPSGERRLAERWRFGRGGSLPGPGPPGGV